MNILYLTNHLNIGGISSYLLTLAKGMKAKGHNAYVASSGGELLKKFTEEGIAYIHLPIKTKSEISPKVLLSWLKLRKVIKEQKIGIIHANTRVTQVLAHFASKSCGRPFVSTCHGFFKKRLSRRIFPCWGEKVIAISQQVKEHLLADFQVKEEEIRVIHNGIDMQRFAANNSVPSVEAKNKLGLTGGPVIGILARLSDVKGHIYLIAAMALVLRKYPQAQLLIVGEGRQKQALADLARHLNIEKSIFFIPALVETEKVLSLMDVFVMPSLKEGLGLSLMEAMAAGLAVIGSDVGGIKTLIQDGYNGLLVEPAQSKQLAQGILRLLDDPQKRNYLGFNAQNCIAQNFSQNKMVEETEKLYTECLKIKN